MIRDSHRDELITFLKSNQESLALGPGTRLNRVQVQERLQELVPAYIEIRGACTGDRAVVAAAPHVSFDHWSEYFCNRVATRFSLGWVVAKHYRDQDQLHIPVSIGRHLHVNRPTESDKPGGSERVTERARAAYEDYVSALAEAGNGPLPLDLLVEFHSHRQSPHVEIATTGIDEASAKDLHNAWETLRKNSPEIPELRIEPFHAVRFTAAGAKQQGSLQPAVCRRALHIEIPRGLRNSESMRQLANGQILAWLETVLERFCMTLTN